MIRLTLEAKLLPVVAHIFVEEHCFLYIPLLVVNFMPFLANMAYHPLAVLPFTFAMMEMATWVQE